MTETTQASAAPTEEVKPSHDRTNPAVDRCCDAYARACKAGKKPGKRDFGASLEGAKAFRKAMPQLSGQENISDFIACVAYGMLIKAIEGPEGARLLYAAQVANSTVRSRRAAPTPLGSLSPLVRQYYGVSD
jgi:hypothetical protein